MNHVTGQQLQAFNTIKYVYSFVVRGKIAFWAVFPSIHNTNLQHRLGMRKLLPLVDLDVGLQIHKITELTCRNILTLMRETQIWNHNQVTGKLAPP